MFCDKENVNILTQLLPMYGVTNVVVCPGSRNAPIVHNLNEHPHIKCHSVVDERSAGFIALGLTIGSKLPSAVCVTSGSALLNVLPAVAEASYQHQGIIVISADRPQAWIDQLDGQTIQQQGALGNFVAKSVTLPEPTDEISRWHCRRLICEALMEQKRTGKSVHINVPISEPLFSFNTEQLPKVKAIAYINDEDYLLESLRNAKRPMIVVGQLSSNSIADMSSLFLLRKKIVTITESLSAGVEFFGNADAALYKMNDITDEYRPDFLLYIGGHLVSKRIKKMLRDLHDIELWHVSESPELHDVSMHADGILQVNDMTSFFSSLRDTINKTNAFDKAFAERWRNILTTVTASQHRIPVEYSQALAIKQLENCINEARYNQVFYANSTAIRLANIYASCQVECNRGINGIEGSLSTAVGAALSNIYDNVFCIIGDLSFFYDSNALAAVKVTKGLRILLLNNHGGGIFHQLTGLEQSPSRDEYVAASHNRTGKDICKHFGVQYNVATDKDTLTNGINWLTDDNDTEPRLLEVITDMQKDAEVYKTIYQLI